MDELEILRFVGDNIRLERLRQRLSQEKLAEMVGVQTHHISKIERGLVDIKFSTLVSILKSLNLAFETLYKL